jgi:hypothetical protein
VDQMFHANRKHREGKIYAVDDRDTSQGKT